MVSSMIDIIAREKFRQSIPFGAFCKPENWRELMKMDKLERHSHQWREIIQVIGEESEKIDDALWLDVCYEDFCGDPGKIMREVFHFIGTEPTAAQLLKIQQMPQENNQKWRTKFSPSETNTMTRIMEQQLIAYNYRL